MSGLEFGTQTLVFALMNGEIAIVERALFRPGQFSGNQIWGIRLRICDALEEWGSSV